MEKKYKIFVIDDHAIVRDGLVNLINDEPDLEVIGTAESCDEALKKLEKKSIDIALVDINLKKRSGLDLISEIKSRFPKIRSIVLSMYDEFIYAPKALSVGAKGYVMKSEDPQKIIDAIRTVIAGDTYISQSLTPSKNKEDDEIFNVVNTLSVRELEIFRSYGQGDSTKDIAKKHCISPKTVQTYRDRIREKLNLKSSNDLVRFAVKWLQL